MVDPSEEDNAKMTSQQALCTPDKDTDTLKDPCCSTLKMFIMSLSFAYFSKALCGTYMKSSITQIERRFDLSSSLVGLIDGSFEMGNLLFLAVVSHFGAKLHRPRLIGSGCFLMAIGSAITGLPHFFMGRYKYDTVIQGSLNETNSVAACQEATVQSNYPNIHQESSVNFNTGSDCEKEPGSYMWVYVFLGNALRGIGETPVTPLGISYIDDFAKAENSVFYIACLQTISLLGPMFGFLMGSMCAKLYVDIGFVNVDSVTITPKDARWVGAWWLGFFVSSSILLLAGIPFWFFPRSLPKQAEEQREDPSSPHGYQEHSAHPATPTMKLVDIAKGFLPSLKKLLGTPVYLLLLCGSILNFNSFIGLITFKAKYMEQQFGQSASRANFLIGVLNLPVVAVGIFLGGLVMKRYKLSVVSGAQLSFLTSFSAYLLMLLQFGTKCDNLRMAGLTVSYNGTPQISYDAQTLFSQCNQQCSCSAAEWDPVCSDDGITYISPCLAGCMSSSGHGKNTAFHNCSCVLSPSPVEGSTSVSLGQCPRGPACSRSFTSYMAVSVLSSFINSLGTTPAYMVIIRCISPELKSLALGIQTLVIRTLAGIPAPVYFGALIDSTCLKWGMKKCGGRGACRLYNSDKYRVIFLGLISCLSGSSYFFVIAVIILLRKQFSKEALRALQEANQGRLELHSPQLHCDEVSEHCCSPSQPGGEALVPSERTVETTESYAPHECPASPSTVTPEKPGVIVTERVNGLTGVDGNLESAYGGQQDLETESRDPAKELAVA
ncbi:solute carrier organic anion transporter family member 1C1 isoform X1 [Pygocentrus nattereri]|uniref:Solute carrier organic anion transporter family member n=1 Tax=Pygocentrus nattereri TaxID=42514 RepID=A0A3B4DHJ1_PYGNA|nr:solute carrier organic anion transporter family member 1C1 isoform X1 [Pygocentrus nattereri]XP_017552394.1 solute carrier organic anion transporter family member 1C1 isoform X1 [Pygocentrus nattereri]XP_037397104.1 solute carrier organic anion transporter family member 1C1 isoform X1 [Pygocentrus nattereri]XP_037397108.1 solute carrier organic anion transporter family member 1C1 isoform X1 [Pygocentrus nattereri]